MSGTTLTGHEARQRLYEIVRRDVPFDEKAEEALELGKQYLGADNGHLTRIDQETDHWEAIVSTDEADGRVPAGLELDLGTTYCRRTLTEDAPIALHDVPNQGWADDPAFETYGLHCYHGTTLIVDDEPFGTVCFTAEDPRTEQFSDGETMFAELITRMLERELEREQHEADLLRQTNLATVLNRVLRHNLRNDMSVIRGFTQLMADKLEDDQYSNLALSNIDKLIALSEKARVLDRFVAADFEREPTEVVALVEGLIRSVETEYPEASIGIEYDEEITAAVFPSFARALEELIENAAKHGGDTPRVMVSIDAAPNAVEIQITDDGPGLADHEADVLKTGTETPLTHGTGLGLWLAHWIVTSHDGSITATATEDGTSLTISIPRKQTAETADVQKQLTQLTRARDQYQAAFEEASDAIVIVNDDARILDANPEAAPLYRVDRQKLLGRALPDILPEAFNFEDVWQELQTAGEIRGTVTFTGTNGADRSIEYSAQADIIPNQHLFISRDITERKEREAELTRKTEAIEKAPVGIVLSDPNQPDNPLVYVNERFCKLTGYEEAEILGRNCRFMQGPETDPEPVAEIRNAIENGEPASTVLRNYQGDGAIFWNHLTIAPVRNTDGEISNWVGFQEDVTERIEREQQLKLAETVFENTQEALFIIDVTESREFHIERVNEVYEELTGLSNAEITGKTPTEAVGDEIGGEIESQYRECVDRQETIKYPEGIPVDGEKRQWETKLTPVITEGKVDKLVGAMRDVTALEASL